MFGMSAKLTPALNYLERTVEGLIAVYLFGSFAKGQERADSDIDLALLAERPIPSLVRLELIGKLSTLLGRPCDVVDLGDPRTSNFLKLEVLKAGPAKLVLNEYQMHIRELAIMRLAEDHAYRQAPYINDIRHRGTVHG